MPIKVTGNVHFHARIANVGVRRYDVIEVLIVWPVVKRVNQLDDTVSGCSTVWPSSPKNCRRRPAGSLAKMVLARSGSPGTATSNTARVIRMNLAPRRYAISPNRCAAAADIHLYRRIADVAARRTVVIHVSMVSPSYHGNQCPSSAGSPESPSNSEKTVPIDLPAVAHQDVRPRRSPRSTAPSNTPG